jgi:hypothetical protein
VDFLKLYIINSVLACNVYQFHKPISLRTSVPTFYLPNSNRGLELQGHMITMFTFEELPDCFPTILWHAIFPPAIYQGWMQHHHQHLWSSTIFIVAILIFRMSFFLFSSAWIWTQGFTLNRHWVIMPALLQSFSCIWAIVLLWFQCAGP